MNKQPRVGDDYIEVIQLLDRAVEQECDRLQAEGAERVDAATEERALQSMEEILELEPELGGESEHNDSHRTSRFKAWIAAAAILAVLGFAAQRLISRGPQTPEDFRLGTTGTLELLEPVDRVAHYREFHWNGTLRDGESFELVIWNLDESPRPVFTQELEETSWRPTHSETDLLSESIRWEVRVLDLSREVREHGSAQASLSR